MVLVLTVVATVGLDPSNKHLDLVDGGSRREDAITLAQAWARQGIRVNGVAPGLVDTKLTKVTIANEERLRERLEGIPAGRLGTPQEMADACLFLASPMASYIYGQTLLVDGGRTL